MKMRSHRNLFRISAAVVVVAAGVWAADNVTIQPRAKPDKKAEGTAPRSNIRVDTTLVQIPVTVTDPLNRFVTGLEKEHFKVFEDKLEQAIVQFSSEDAP